MFYYFGNHQARKELLQELLLDHTPSVVAVDTETISLKQRIPIGLSIAVTPHDAFYFPTFPDVSEDIPWHILDNPNITKVFHNAPFDLIALQILHPVNRTNIADTNTMAHLLGKGYTSLQALAPEVGRIAVSAKEMLGVGQTMIDLSEESVAEKCCNDSEITLALYYHYEPQIDKKYFAVEMAIIPILLDMSNRGLAVDQKVRSRLEHRLEADVDFYKTIADGEGFNPASNQQVGYILAKRGVFLPFTRSRKSLRTDEETLELVDDPMAALVLNFRRANKLLTTYVKPLAHEDRIYTEYNLDAITGRISSANRNMQNIPPGEPRSMFYPDTGTFTEADYSQEELRILAYISGDREMTRIYEEKGDIHEFTARTMRIPRRTAKSVNFAILYGATAETIRTTAKIRDLRKCYDLLDKWFSTFKDAAEWVKGIQNDGLRYGYVDTLFGRRIRLPLGLENDSAIKRKAVNYIIQGTGAEIMKRALIMCSHLPLALTVHDSMLFDGDVEKEIRQLDLEHISLVYTPIETKLLYRWE